MKDSCSTLEIGTLVSLKDQRPLLSHATDFKFISFDVILQVQPAFQLEPFRFVEGFYSNMIFVSRRISRMKTLKLIKFVGLILMVHDYLKNKFHHR